MTQVNSLNMLQFLEKLLKHGSFTKAAKNMYVSQPYLTQVIKKKEAELGIEIINRETHPLQLTEAGRVYYQYLINSVSEQEQLKKNLEKYLSPDKTIIRLGVLPTLGTYVLPLFIPKFLAKHPQVHIDLTEAAPAVNESRLLKGELDFLVGQNPETLPAQLTSHYRGPHGYYAVIPESSPLYRPGELFLPDDSIDIKDLLQQKLILTRAGSAIRRQFDYLFQKLAIRPNIIFESSNIYTIGRLAQANLGITFVPQSVHLALDDRHYNFYRLPLEVISLNYYIAHPTDKPLSDIDQDLIKIFLTEIENHL